LNFISLIEWPESIVVIVISDDVKLSFLKSSDVDLVKFMRCFLESRIKNYFMCFWHELIKVISKCFRCLFGKAA